MSVQNVELSFECGDTSLSVRHFRVEEALSEPFRVEVLARSPDEDLDLSAFVGRRASLRLANPLLDTPVRERAWSGICASMRATRAEDAKDGLSTYELTIVPRLWLLGQRRDHRLFQHTSIPAIVEAILAEWGIVHAFRIDQAQYPALELRTQYGETDLAFVCRLLEEAGISFCFEDHQDDARLVLCDSLGAAPLHARGPVTFVDDPSSAYASSLPFVTGVAVHEEVRPGAVTLRDHDFQNPRYRLFAQALAGSDVERYCEQYHHAPSAFVRELSGGPPSASADAATPVADDLGTARADRAFGEWRARRALEALRADKKTIAFRTNVVDLPPGSTFAVAGHPRTDLSADRPLLVRRFHLEGDIGDTWSLTGEAVPTDRPHRPAQRTAKARLHGLQVAVVVGPEPGSCAATGAVLRAPLPHRDAPAPAPENIAADDIYADEHGRVRVQFPWDREGVFSAKSSAWMRVAQSWAGPGHGVFSLPRVGTEVLVAFVDGDPDAPLVVSAVHNATAPAPYRLPENKTVTTWRSKTSPASTGFNELRFEDAAGREHVYMQAQMDMDALVKNDLQQAVGRDRAAFVQRDETVAVGHNRIKVVKTNEVGVSGANKSETVGLNRVSTVGVEDSTFVGSRWSVTVARGLSARLGPRLGRLVDGPLGAVMASTATAVLGRMPQGPLGGVTGGAGAALGSFRRKVTGLLQNVLGVHDGFEQVEGPPPTTVEVVDRRIELTTGEASIILDGPNIALRASGNVVIEALKSVTVVAEEEVAVAGREKVAVLSVTDDVLLQAAGDLHLNPFSRGEGAEAMESRLDALPEEEGPGAANCASCGRPLEGGRCPAAGRHGGEEEAS